MDTYIYIMFAYILIFIIIFCSVCEEDIDITVNSGTLYKTTSLIRKSKMGMMFELAGIYMIKHFTSFYFTSLSVYDSIYY